MTGFVRCCRNPKQRTCKIIFAWHLAEYLNDVQFIARSSRPAKNNGTYIPENRQQALGARDRGAFIDTSHRRTDDNIIVNRHKRQSRKSWKLVRQFACLPFAFAEPFDSRSTPDLNSITTISTPRFGSPPATQLNSRAIATPVSIFEGKNRQ
jgi:hypothetical protein